MFQFPSWPSVCESRRSISFNFQTFITPTPTYMYSLDLSLDLSPVFKIKEVISGDYWTSLTNPRNIHIPHYRLTVSTGTNCLHDMLSSVPVFRSFHVPSLWYVPFIGVYRSLYPKRPIYPTHTLSRTMSPWYVPLSRDVRPHWPVPQYSPSNER